MQFENVPNYTISYDLKKNSIQSIVSFTHLQQTRRRKALNAYIKLHKVSDLYTYHAFTLTIAWSIVFHLATSFEHEESVHILQHEQQSLTVLPLTYQYALNMKTRSIEY